MDQIKKQKFQALRKTFKLKKQSLPDFSRNHNSELVFKTKTTDLSNS